MGGICWRDLTRGGFLQELISLMDCTYSSPRQTQCQVTSVGWKGTRAGAGAGAEAASCPLILCAHLPAPGEQLRAPLLLLTCSHSGPCGARKADRDWLTVSLTLSSASLDRFKGLKPTIILLSRGISDAESSWRAGQGWQRKGRLRSVVWARTKPPPSE